MKNLEKLTCIAYIALFTGMTIASIGRVPTHGGEPYSWTLVVSVFSFMAAPAVLGYLAGRKDGKAANAQ